MSLVTSQLIEGISRKTWQCNFWIDPKDKNPVRSFVLKTGGMGRIRIRQLFYFIIYLFYIIFSKIKISSLKFQFSILILKIFEVVFVICHLMIWILFPWHRIWLGLWFDSIYETNQRHPHSPFPSPYPTEQKVWPSGTETESGKWQFTWQVASFLELNAEKKNYLFYQKYNNKIR